jgi:hypothetical protein
MFNLIASPLLKWLRFKICEVDALSALLSSVGWDCLQLLAFNCYITSFFADATMEIKSRTLTEVGEIILI